MESKESVTCATSSNLISSISPYLDLHMMFPLLEYVDSLITNGAVSYSPMDVAAARLSLLRPTHMVDYAMDIYHELHGDEAHIPEDMEIKKNKVFDELEELRTGCKTFEDLCQNPEMRTKLVSNGSWNITDLSKLTETGVSAEVVETYRQLAKFNFNCGYYRSANEMLSNLISLYAVSPLPKELNEDEDIVDDERSMKKQEDHKQQNIGNPNVYYLTTINTYLLQILWGKLACDILVEEWDEASRALTAVKLSIEQLAHTNRIMALDALQQRTWLLHWSLFVFWNNSGSKGLESMVELFFTEKYLQAITTNAPHLLRYLTSAVLLCKRRVANNPSKDGRSSGAEARKLLKDLVRVMQNCEYNDPIVEFVDCLCVKFDFESAQSKLIDCEHVLSTDFFLCKQTALFMEEARVFVFENYCRIHTKIDLAVLGEKLAMDQESAERWIVDLIRNALLDAKIDSEEKCVVMGSDNQTVYEQVIERTKDLNIRSANLTQNLLGFLTNTRKEATRIKGVTND